MAPTDERTTKPEQLVNVQNTNPGFVVQIPEGLYRLRKIHFHPLIVLKSRMNSNWTSALTTRVVLFVAATLTAITTHAVDKPNIVFIFADDWGWGDLGCAESRSPCVGRCRVLPVHRSQWRLFAESGSRDELMGSGGLDWFFAKLGQDLTDWELGEILTSI